MPQYKFRNPADSMSELGQSLGTLGETIQNIKDHSIRQKQALLDLEKSQHEIDKNKLEAENSKKSILQLMQQAATTRTPEQTSAAVNQPYQSTSPQFTLDSNTVVPNTFINKKSGATETVPSPENVPVKEIPELEQNIQQETAKVKESQAAQEAAATKAKEQYGDLANVPSGQLKDIIAARKEFNKENENKNIAGYINPMTGETSLTPKEGFQGVGKTVWDKVFIESVKSKNKQLEDNLTPETIELEASKYRLTGEMPPLGFKAGTRVKIMNRAAEQARSEGQTAEALALNKAAFAAGKNELTNLQKNRGMILAFEKTARSNFDIVRNLSKKVDRSGVPILNKWIAAGKHQTGDPDIDAFNTAVQTARNEYARVVTTVTGGGVTSDSARREVDELLNKTQTPDQVLAVLDTMEKDMGNRKTGYEDQINETRDAIKDINLSSKSVPKKENRPSLDSFYK